MPCRAASSRRRPRRATTSLRVFGSRIRSLDGNAIPICNEAFVDRSRTRGLSSIGFLRRHGATRCDRLRRSGLIENRADFAECADRRAAGSEDQARTGRPVEHPRRDNDRRGGVRECADEDLLTAALLAVMDVDLAAMRRMPRIVNLRAKCDMGRMTFELSSDGKTITAPARGAEPRSRPSSTASSSPPSFAGVDPALYLRRAAESALAGNEPPLPHELSSRA